MSRPRIHMAARLIALSCIAALVACDSDPSTGATDGEADTESVGNSATGDDSADPSGDPMGATSGQSASGGSTDSTDSDPTSTDDSTDSGDPTGDPTTDSETTGTPDGGPQLPELQGECPEFTAGSIGNPALLTFPVGAGTRQALVWFDPSEGGGGPLVFFFHGGGGQPEQAEDTVTDDAIVDIVGRGGMVIAPISDPAANLEWFLASGSAQNDVVMMDSMVACADAGPGIDRYHIHGVGFSAGGLHVAISALLRSSYMASTVTYSGGVYNGVTSDDPDAVPSALAFHGGNSDNVGGLPFDSASTLYANQIRERSGYAMVCNHNTGHGYPDNVPGEFRRADMYNFLLDHPWGVEPHPYPTNGIPDWLPSYCSDQP